MTKDFVFAKKHIFNKMFGYTAVLRRMRVINNTQEDCMDDTYNDLLIQIGCDD